MAAQHQRWRAQHHGVHHRERLNHIFCRARKSRISSKRKYHGSVYLLPPSAKGGISHLAKTRAYLLHGAEKAQPYHMENRRKRHRGEEYRARAPLQRYLTGVSVDSINESVLRSAHRKNRAALAKIMAASSAAQLRRAAHR